MKTHRISSTIFTVHLAVLSAWLLCAANASQFSEIMATTSIPAEVSTPVSQPKTTTPTSGPAPLPAGSQAATVDEMMASPAGQARIQQFQQVANGENSRPLNLYGKIIDQNGAPVAGVKVLGQILLIAGFDHSGRKSHYTETDTQGRFQFVGLQGVSLTVTPQKSGYEYDARSHANWSSAYHPDPSRPMVFTLWKLQGPEPMLHADVNRRLPYDGQSGKFTASFDLATGKIMASGELLITVTQNPVVVNRGAGPFDWKIDVAAPAGGLVEALDLYKNQAPESGFKETYSFAQGKSDPKWAGRFAKTFYVHTVNGHYARVMIDLTPGTNRPADGLGIGLSLATWLNPSGSRNLEFDPAKEIKPSAPRRGL